MTDHSSADRFVSAMNWLLHKFMYLSIVLFFIAVAAAMDHSAKVNRPFLIYLAAVLFLSFLTAVFLGGKLAGGEAAVARDKARAGFRRAMFYVDCLGIGMAPAFALFGTLSVKWLAGFAAALLTLAVVIGMIMKRQGQIELRLISILNIFVIGFYVLIGPLYLARHLYRLAHGHFGVGLSGFLLLVAAVTGLLILEILLAAFIGLSRDLSGAYATSHRAKWVYKDTKEHVRWANKRETGEWSPPLRTPLKFLIVQGLLIIVSLVLGGRWSAFFAHAPLRYIESYLGRFLSSQTLRGSLVVYVCLLALSVLYYFLKSRKTGKR